MAEINANIVVEPITLSVVSTENQIGVTVDSTNIGVYTTSPTSPGGNAGEIQYNSSGTTFNGIPTVTYDGSNITLGNVDEVKITGGTNGYFLQTDGSGNLVWTAGTANVSGNGTAAGANGAVQFSDGTGNFSSDSGFNYDSGLNTLYSQGVETTTVTVTNLYWTPPNNATILGNAASGGSAGTAYGYLANAQGVGTVAVGSNAYSLGANSVAIGTSARAQGVDSISIGKQAGALVGVVGSKRIAIGSNAGWGGSGVYGWQIAIGNDAGRGQENFAIAIGEYAGGNNQSDSAIAIGFNAGLDNQGTDAIAIGKSTGNNQGRSSIAIGPVANAQANNSIALSADGTSLTANTANAFFVKPIRQVSSLTGLSQLYYDPATGEIVVYVP